MSTPLGEVIFKCQEWKQEVLKRKSEMVDPPDEYYDGYYAGIYDAANVILNVIEENS